MTESAPVTTVYLIDDEAIIRAGLCALLEQSASFRVIGESGDARTAISEVGQLRPDVAIVDIAMPGLSGLDAIDPIKRASPRTKILIASQHEGQRFVQQAIEAGADGYLSKSSDPVEIRIGIESVCRGDSFLSPRVMGPLVGWNRRVSKQPISALAALTSREREVFQLVAIGRANKEIASILDVSLGTVKKHRENLQRKLDCHSAAEIARMAIREGLVSP